MSHNKYRPWWNSSGPCLLRIPGPMLLFSFPLPTVRFMGIAVGWIVSYIWVSPSSQTLPMAPQVRPNVFSYHPASPRCGNFLVIFLFVYPFLLYLLFSNLRSYSVVSIHDYSQRCANSFCFLSSVMVPSFYLSHRKHFRPLCPGRELSSQFRKLLVSIISVGSKS